MKFLEGIRVIDCSRVLAGPHCGQMLADMGADVIKVESPEGDENRSWQPLMPSGQSSNFASVNRGKRAMTLNLKAPAGRDILARLVGEADVLLHNFLPATADRLGLDWDRLRALNPRLVYCTISGYGREGPLANKPGYDLTVQAFSGIMSTTGLEGAPPMRIGASCIDMATGMAAYGAIVGALLARTRTDTGAWVRASLLETAVALLGYHGIGWLQAGILPKKQGSGSPSSVPYQAFQCRDGYILAGAPNDAAWARFCKALDLPELVEDARFRGVADRVANREVLIAILEPAFAAAPVADLLERLEAAAVAVAPIHDLDRALGHPQILANAMVIDHPDGRGGTEKLLGMPIKMSADATPAPRPVPRLGADTDEILRDLLGLNDQEIGELRQADAI